MLKGQFGLRPNILCRLGLCVSLNDPRPPNPEEFDTEGMEMNRYTLTGEYDDLLIGLLRERCHSDGVTDEETMVDQMVAHINRGVHQIFNKADSLADLDALFPREEELTLD